MSALGGTLRQEGLKVAEARVRTACMIEVPYECAEWSLWSFCNVCIASCERICCRQVRALTREVGSLKEDLRREIKRRERATFSIREAEELKQEAEKRVKQLEYSKRSVVALYHSNSPSSCETTGYAQYKQHAGS